MASHSCHIPLEHSSHQSSLSELELALLSRAPQTTVQCKCPKVLPPLKLCDWNVRASLTQFPYYHEMLNMQKGGRWALKWEDPVYPSGVWWEWNLPNPGNLFAREADIQALLIYSCCTRPPSTRLPLVPAFTCFLASYVDGSCPTGPLALQVMESWGKYQLDIEDVSVSW